MHRDFNLLFGVFVVQLRKATPERVMEAAGAWATDPSTDLPERLVQMAAISQKDRRLIERLITEAIDECGGDEVTPIFWTVAK